MRSRAAIVQRNCGHCLSAGHDRRACPYRDLPMAEARRHTAEGRELLERRGHQAVQAIADALVEVPFDRWDELLATAMERAHVLTQHSVGAVSPGELARLSWRLHCEATEAARPAAESRLRAARSRLELAQDGGQAAGQAAPALVREVAALERQLRAVEMATEQRRAPDAEPPALWLHRKAQA